AGPSKRLDDAKGLDGMTQENGDQISEPERDAFESRGASSQRRGKQAHGVGFAGIANGLNVGVLVNIHSRADGDALRQVFANSRSSHREQRFGVGPDMSAQLIADARKRSAIFQIEQQVHGS